MTSILKKYPLSLFVTAAVWYLSFFTPPQTELSEINNFDKLVHTCMYGGLCSIIWLEYLRANTTLRWKHIIGGIIILPTLMSGIIELMQQYLTQNRGGEWWDFAANISGILLAALIGYYIQRPFWWRQNR